MKQYVNPVHLVTTRDGTCPDGHLEVEIVGPWLRTLLHPATTRDAFERAVDEARHDCHVFGTGVIKLLPDGTVRHVPLNEVRFDSPFETASEQKP